MKFITRFAALPSRVTHAARTAWVASSCLNPAAIARRDVETATNQFAANGNASLPVETTPQVTKPLRSGTKAYQPGQQFQTNKYPQFGRSEKVRSGFSAPLNSPPLASDTESEASGDDTSGPGVVSEKSVEWLSRQPFSPEVVAILQAPLAFDEAASKPTGGGLTVPYLPEIKYRRILNKAFGPGAWALLPAGPVKRESTTVYRDYQMFVFGRLVSEARGQQSFFSKGKTIDTVVEGIKSNALMRCCKDLGIASELWDPDWVREWQSRQPARSASTAYRF